jgi:hypothetical protein
MGQITTSQAAARINNGHYSLHKYLRFLHFFKVIFKEVQTLLFGHWGEFRTTNLWGGGVEDEVIVA